MTGRDFVDVGDFVYRAGPGTGVVESRLASGEVAVRFLDGVRRAVDPGNLVVTLRPSDPAPLVDSIRKDTPLLNIRCLMHWLVLGDTVLAGQAAGLLVSSTDEVWLEKADEELRRWDEQRRAAAIDVLDRWSVSIGVATWDARVEPIIRERAAARERGKVRTALLEQWSGLGAQAERAVELLTGTVTPPATLTLDEASHPTWGEYTAYLLPGSEEERASLLRTAHLVAESARAWAGKLKTGAPQATLDDATRRLEAASRLLAPVGTWMGEYEERRARVERAQVLTQAINEARVKRGDPVLDAREMVNVLRNLDRNAADPRRYRNSCWRCHAVVDAGTNEACIYCSWLVCWCGACREVVWRDGEQVPTCHAVSWAFPGEFRLADTDAQGRPVVTATRPSGDAEQVRLGFEQHGVRRLFHWSPERGARSILERGILSRDALLESGVRFVPHSYGSRDKQYALEGYVALSMVPKDAMMTTWSENPVVFEVDPGAVLANGVLFIPGNSASRGIDLDRDGIRGAAAATRLFDPASGRPVAQAEIWIPRQVPRAAITRVYVSTAEMAEGLAAYLAAEGRAKRTIVEHRPKLASYAVRGTRV